MTETSTSWRPGAQLPVSYRVAIAVDVFVLLTTAFSLVLLGVYIRQQLWRRKRGLLRGDGKEEGFSDDGEGGEEGVGNGEGRKGGKKGHVRWTSSVVGMGVFSRLSVSEEGRVKLEGGEGNWKGRV